jgi:solute carrier family 25 carnitine/acylcarnitine transporter 20/29
MSKLCKKGAKFRKLEFCHIQVQQGASGPPKYNGPVHVVKSLWKEGGIRSIYKGTVATLLRDVPANAAYFGGYEIIQRMMIPGLNYL